MQKKTSPCDNCKVVHPCHRYIKQRADGDLASMHLHLHRVGALDDKEKLTPFGEIARYLPQGGGLLIAKAIHDGDLNGDNLGQYAELLAALSLARHKEPSRKGSYKFPFSLTPLEARLEKLYPLRLFPELYDLKPRRYNEPVIREFNPEAGYIINLWIRGIDYTELVKECSGDFFSSGDIMNLIYRVATYLQSISQAKVGDLSRLAAELRRHILRHPLEIAMNIG